MSERPLHVRVAEALGWTNLQDRYGPDDNGTIHHLGGWRGSRPGEGDTRGTDRYDFIPNYDTDWSATGPLIAAHVNELESPDAGGGRWHAHNWGMNSDLTWTNGGGDTALLAVCDLVLKLAAEDRLREWPQDERLG